MHGKKALASGIEEKPRAALNQGLDFVKLVIAQVRRRCFLLGHVRHASVAGIPPAGKSRFTGARPPRGDDLPPVLVRRASIAHGIAPGPRSTGLRASPGGSLFPPSGGLPGRFAG